MQIGIFGFFSFEKEDFGGQPVKTNQIYQYLLCNFPLEKIITYDTLNWSQNKIKSFFSFIRFYILSNHIILLPASNGIKTISMLINFLHFFTIKKKIIHYVVIGGWLPDLIQNNEKLRSYLKKFNYIYVETNTLKYKLYKLNLTNILLMNNIKNVEYNLSPYKDNKKFRFCFYSRVIENKGIEEAINAVKLINEDITNITCTLDIYGPVDNEYLSYLTKSFSQEIKYCGIIQSSKGISDLSSYFMQLFPTKYFTEGVPGSVVDSFFAGLPILASKWESSNDVIKEYYNGVLFNFGCFDDLVNKMKWCVLNYDTVNKMRKNCISSSFDYVPENALKPLKNNLKESWDGNKSI